MVTRLDTAIAAGQTHVAVECRLTVGEADALDQNLAVFASMVRREVCSARGCDAETLLVAIAKVREQLTLRMEPFDEVFGS